jgi:hypothetical protein
MWTPHNWASVALHYMELPSTPLGSNSTKQRRHAGLRLLFLQFLGLPRNECVYVSCGVRRPINDPGIPLHSTSEARHAYWLSPSAGRRRGHCQRPQVRIGAQGQSWVSCGHVQGVGVGVARCCCSCGCGCGWLLLPAVCEVLLVWLLVFLASMLTVQ